MTKQANPWLYRLYPEPNSSLYARVLVWPTQGVFLHHMRQNNDGQRWTTRVRGACTRMHVTKYGDAAARRRPIFATVNFCVPHLGMSVVTHELFHATMAWAHRVKFPLTALTETMDVTDDEERITYAHSEMCRQFMVKATRRHGPYEARDSLRAPDWSKRARV